MSPIQNTFIEAQAAFSRLTPREKTLVSIASALAVALLLYLVMSGFASTARKHEKAIELGLNKLAEARSLSGTYQQAQQKRAALEMQLTQNNIRLLSYVEEKGTAAGLQIPTITPLPDQPLDEQLVESSVDITLTDIKIDKLVNFLSTIESGPGIVKVKRVRVEPRVANENLTAWITISTYRVKL